jgi:hypothetical protein
MLVANKEEAYTTYSVTACERKEGGLSLTNIEGWIVTGVP